MIQAYNHVRWSGPAGCDPWNGACDTSWCVAGCLPSEARLALHARTSTSYTLSIYTNPRTSSHARAGEPAPINHHHRKRMRGVRQVQLGVVSHELHSGALYRHGGCMRGDRWCGGMACTCCAHACCAQVIMAVPSPTLHIYIPAAAYSAARGRGRNRWG